MYTRNKEVGPKRERSGLVSHILLQRGDLGRSNPVIEAADPRSRFGAGLGDYRRKGQDAVKEEEWEAGAGDLVYIPSGAVHGIGNASETCSTSRRRRPLWTRKLTTIPGNSGLRGERELISGQ